MMNIPQFCLLIFSFLSIFSCKQGKEITINHCGDPPKYYKEYILPEGMIGYNNYDQALQCAKTLDKPLAIFLGGWACVNCRYFEERFLSLEETKNLINNNFVFASLFLDETIKLPKEDQMEYERGGRKKRIKTIGNLNSYIQTTKFHSGSQPYIYFIDHEENIIDKISYSGDNEKLLSTLKETILKLD